MSKACPKSYRRHKQGLAAFDGHLDLGYVSGQSGVGNRFAINEIVCRGLPFITQTSFQRWEGRRTWVRCTPKYSDIDFCLVKSWILLDCKGLYTLYSTLYILHNTRSWQPHIYLCLCNQPKMSRCGLVLKLSNEVCSRFGGLKIVFAFPFQFELVAGEMG